MEQKGLHCYVYRSPLGDCTNNGISRQNDRILLLHSDPNKNIGPFERKDKESVLLALYREKFNDWIAVPEDYILGEKWYMFGGNFLYTSDSRFPSKYPMYIHDRRE